MARATRAAILEAGERGEREVIASLGSGKNPDGTDFTLPIDGAITMTGSATAANQTTGNASLATIATNTAKSGSLTDRSGTITTGGTAQDAMVANASRKYIYLENPVSATEDLWFRLTGTAAAASPSRVLHAGDVYNPSFIPTQALSVFAATTAHAFIAEEG